MAEAMRTFQSQLSVVMETVFKAAMYEITRLVEDSFVEELTRCRQQVDTLKRRVRCAESRRSEPAGRCADCGGGGWSAQTTPAPGRESEKSLKQENVGLEESEGSQGSAGETQNQAVEKAKPEDRMNSTRQTDAEKEKFQGVLKEESLQSMPELRESQDWGVNADDIDKSSLPGPSKCFTEQKIPKWETGFVQRTESSQDGHTGYPSEPLFQSRYGVDGLAGFDKASYGDTSLIGSGSFEGLQSSPSHLAGNLSYVARYDEDVEAPADTPQESRGADCSPAGSPSRTNMDVSGEFSCLLINEEGFLQDTNVLYPGHVSADSGGRLGFRSQAVRFNLHPEATEDVYEVSNTCGDVLNPEGPLQHQTAGCGGRRDTCNSLSFPDSVSLKVHKQTHKGSAQGPPYSCKQCGKTFTQACNLKVHQRIHSGQGLHLCNHCGKGFPSFTELKTHKCGQSGDKPYCCTVCGNKFSRLWNLKLHRRIHTQEKPHRCTMCDKSFTRADILKVHQRTHTGERPYRCSVCGLSFKRLDHLKSHQRKHVTHL
ncbi:zinc finger protein 773 [Cololabis saira]|uniref:zinc finger protein 773 n=1 Tax=Cololabis saira TaxID=129043 RepID=UPI002AD39C66|nr:zinc finger protein 773 [Cololabis saira]